MTIMHSMSGQLERKHTEFTLVRENARVRNMPDKQRRKLGITAAALQVPTQSLAAHVYLIGILCDRPDCTDGWLPDLQPFRPNATQQSLHIRLVTEISAKR